MAKIPMKDIYIEYQINHRDEHGDANHCDHLVTYVGKSWNEEFFGDSDPSESPNSILLNPLDSVIKEVNDSEVFNDIEVYVHMILSNGDIDRVYGNVGEKVFYAFNGDYCIVPPIVIRDWDGRNQQQIESMIK